MNSRTIDRWPSIQRQITRLILLTYFCNFAGADQLHTTMEVHAAVVSACWELKAGRLFFGDYTQGGIAPLVSSTSVRVTRSDRVRFVLDANAGTSFANGTRRMVSSSPAPATLDYSLYTSSAGSQTWGSEAGGSPIEGTGTDTEQIIPIYGSIPAGQSPPLGSYMDSVLVTLSF